MIEVNGINFTLETPSPMLEFVTTMYPDAFFSFLLEGNKKALTRPRMKKAINLFTELAADNYSEHEIDRAQLSINNNSIHGVQNIVVVRFFCEFIRDSEASQ